MEHPYYGHVVSIFQMRKKKREKDWFASLSLSPKGGGKCLVLSVITNIAFITTLTYYTNFGELQAKKLKKYLTRGRQKTFLITLLKTINYNSFAHTESLKNYS